jgi:hypothetical protein
VGITEVEPVERLADDDREASIGGEIHVVRIVDRDRGSGLPVRGLIGVRLFPVSLVTYSVFRSYEGTTC